MVYAINVQRQKFNADTQSLSQICALLSRLSCLIAVLHSAERCYYLANGQPD